MQYRRVIRQSYVGRFIPDNQSVELPFLFNETGFLGSIFVAFSMDIQAC